VPDGPGGGTVFFVSDHHVRYLKDIEMREEGGTPQIVESIRAGLVMKLKLDAGPQFIIARENEVHGRALEKWEKCSNLILLGPHTESCLPIVSFLISHPETGLYLHFNFIVALLNDLFGIQVRGGCLCAGPYMQSILGLDKQLTDDIESILLEDSSVPLRQDHEEHFQWDVLKPGVTRINLPWFSSDQEIDFIVSAVALVAEQGWKLLPAYRFNKETGDWHHSANTKFKDRRWLGHVTFKSGKMEVLGGQPFLEVGTAPSSYEEVLRLAQESFDGAKQVALREKVPDQLQNFTKEALRLRWFVIPSEAKMCLLDPDKVQKTRPPFSPIRFQGFIPGSLLGEIPGSLLGEILSIQQDSHLNTILVNSEPFVFSDWLPKSKDIHQTCNL